MGQSSPLTVGLSERRTLHWAFLSSLIAGCSSVLLLALSGWFLTAAAVAGMSGSAAVLAFNYLLPSAAIRGLAIARTVGRYGERLLAHRSALITMATYRSQLFAKLASQESRWAIDLSGGDASARLLGDIAALEDLIVRQPARPANVIAAMLAVGLAFLAGWRSAAVLALFLAVLPVILGVTSRRLTNGPARDAASALGALRTCFVEFAAARAEIICYGLVDDALAELGRSTKSLDEARRRLFHSEGIISGLMAGYSAFAVATVLVVSAASAAQVALVLLASAAAIEAMSAFARTSLRQASVDASLARLAKLIALPGAPAKSTCAHNAGAALALNGVVYPAGSRIALLGPSGSGKTSFVESLAALRPAAYQARVDGISIQDCTSQNLRDQFALVPQDGMLIAGTISDNLRLARPHVTTMDMWKVLKVACLDDRILLMPDSLETRLEEGGGTLSGGETKRLALARAILAGRPWLILDEPTEGLDSKTEAEVITRVDRWLEATATGLILVSHRPEPLSLATVHIPMDQLKKLGSADAE